MQASDASTVRPIAVDEGEYLRWNADPFDLDGGSGASETDPGDAHVTAAIHVCRRHLTVSRCPLLLHLTVSRCPLLLLQATSSCRTGWRGVMRGGARVASLQPRVALPLQPTLLTA